MDIIISYAVILAVFVLAKPYQKPIKTHSNLMF
jgi:hypothetical protein